MIKRTLIYFVAKVKMVPASAPDVSQLSDTSVKLNWTVVPNDRLKIVFYRIQYRVIKPKKSPWQTDETEIQGDHRQYEVKNLVPGITNILLTRLMIRTKMYKYRDGRFCRTDS
jgi:hypothetical protein